ncbi:hypothetical protein [Peribacillus simplex]|uniref:hypothetical protein n=1 Tax=Peribacillus simplex TaxID=1478 RepID=UPI00366B2C8E
MVSTICAFTPDRQEIYRYAGGPVLAVPEQLAWTRIQQGGGVIELFGGGFGLFATMRNVNGFQNGHLWWWRRRLGIMFNGWHPIGRPGYMFAVTSESVYGLTPDRSAVYRYDGYRTGTLQENNWTRVGGPAGRLYGGKFGLFATNPSNGNLFRYLGSPDKWEFIGLPGASFAVTGDTVYGLTPDRSAVYRYDGFGSNWTRVGGPAKEIYGGEYGLVATSPIDGNLFRYLNRPDYWILIGGPGASFAVTRDTVYGLTPDKGAVYQYSGLPNIWNRVGGAADAIYAFEEQD